MPVERSRWPTRPPEATGASRRQPGRTRPIEPQAGSGLGLYGRTPVQELHVTLWPFGNSSPLLRVGLVHRDARLEPCPNVRLTGVSGGTETAVGPHGAATPTRGKGCAELLVLQHENTVLRRQLSPTVRYEPADRLWFAALSSLIPRRR